MGEMPLADHVCVVSGEVEDFGDGHAVAIQLPLISRIFRLIDHVADSGLVRIQSGNQASPSGTATPCVVELREPEPVLGEGIDVGSLHFAAKTSDVRVAHVVDHHEHDVWSRTFRFPFSASFGDFD